MRKNAFQRMWVFILMLSFSSALYCQSTIPKLTLEDIYKNRKYGQQGYGQVRWMKDNTGYSTVEMKREKRAPDIMRYDARTGTRSILISAG